MIFFPVEHGRIGVERWGSTRHGKCRDRSEWRPVRTCPDILRIMRFVADSGLKLSKLMRRRQASPFGELWCLMVCGKLTQVVRFMTGTDTCLVRLHRN